MNILFLCTGNSCRSQMAEGLANHIYKNNKEFSFYSAGIETHGMNPWAIKVMEEIGIDISNHHSKLLEELDHVDIDLVVTVCSSAHETCPIFPKACKVIHHGFDDPPRLSKGLEDEKEILAIYAKVRDEIKEFILSLENQIK